MTDESASLRARIEALEWRVSELSRAAVRISASLDPDAVLQEVVDSARALTGARYGLITTVDEAGRPRRFVGSGDHGGQAPAVAGLGRWAAAVRASSAASRRAELLTTSPDTSGATGSRRACSPTVPGRARRSIAAACASAISSSSTRRTEVSSRPATRNCLPLFASQAGTAISNARAFRDERRARSQAGSPGLHLTGRRGGPGRRDRRGRVGEPRGKADCRGRVVCRTAPSSSWSRFSRAGGPTGARSP